MPGARWTTGAGMARRRDRKIVRRRGVVRVICTNQKHKQRQG